MLMIYWNGKIFQKDLESCFLNNRVILLQKQDQSLRRWIILVKAPTTDDDDLDDGGGSDESTESDDDRDMSAPPNDIVSLTVVLLGVRFCVGEFNMDYVCFSKLFL